MPRLAATFLLAAAGALAQPSLSFEVASVKASPITAGSWVHFLPGGRLSAASWLKQLIQIAYGVEDFQVSGGPAWLGSQWYEIEARAPSADASPEEMRRMVRALLEERFHLQLRREEKSFPVFFLEPDQHGPKLTPRTPGEKSGCTRDNSFVCGLTSPAELARSLRHILGRPVLDRTGLTATYDILLDFDVYAIQGKAAPPDYSKPALTTALREQLGLRLKPGSADFAVLVIDKVERPAAN